jgi:hypothetical protein
VASRPLREDPLRTVRDHRTSTAPSTYQAKTAARPGYKEGGQCKVETGTNKGETGTYSEGYCCDEKDWGCTDCMDTSGKPNGACKSTTRASILEHPTFKGSDATGRYMIRRW